MNCVILCVTVHQPSFPDACKGAIGRRDSPLGALPRFCEVDCHEHGGPPTDPDDTLTKVAVANIH